MEDFKLLKKRLLYQSQHRGMREMDLVLGGFAQHYIPLMTQEELKQFETLLAFPDQDLQGWVFEKAPTPEGPLSSLILKLKMFHVKHFP